MASLFGSFIKKVSDAAKKAKQNSSNNSSSNKNTSSGTKNIYSGMSSSELDNERKYLNNLISGGGGNAEWAKNQLTQLNSVTPTTPTTPTSSIGSSGNQLSQSSQSSSQSSTSTSNKTPTASDYLGALFGPVGSVIGAVAKPVISTATQQIDKYLSDQRINVPPQEEKQVEEELEDPYEEAEKRYEEWQQYVKEQQRLANEAAVKSGVERLENQLKTTGQSFDEAGRNAYIQATQAEYALPNQLAAMGYTGGLSETEAARNRANYQNTMANLEQNRVNAQNEIYAAINNLRNTADQRTAEQNIELAREYADKLAQLELQGDLYRQQQSDRDLENFANYGAYQYYDDLAARIQELQAINTDGQYNDQIAILNRLRQQKVADLRKQQLEDDEIARQAALTEYERNLNDAKIAADIGDFSKLQSLGFTTDNLQKQWNADLQKTIKSSQSDSTPKPNLTYKQILDKVSEIAPSQGGVYEENLAAARYILNSDLDTSDAVKVMKQVNVRPETFAREMVKEGYPDKDIIEFIELYTPKPDYRDSIYEYAYAK